MLSYQHGYHAGNLADVHKHAALSWCLDYLTRKDKPLSYLETHAGRALYDLSAPEARRTGEAAQGIARAATWFAPDHPYARVLARVRADHGEAAYPGSPLIAARLLRPADTITLAELHPQEAAALRDAMAPYRAEVLAEDGLAAALSRTPPEPKRGLLLCDPSWEVKADWRTIPETLTKLHRRWNVGVLMLWFPVLVSGLHEGLVADLSRRFPDGLLHRVAFPPARPGHGMIGSGLFIVNPPWGLADELEGLSARFAAL